MGYSQYNPRQPRPLQDETDHRAEVNLAQGQLVVLSSLTDSIIHLLEDFQHQLQLAMQPYKTDSIQGASNPMDEALHTVELLFNVLLYDNQLPEAIKVHVARMQTLYVKIAASDPAFYHQEDHPARCLLSELVNEAKSPDYGMEEESKIIHAVEQILAGFDTDKAIFEKLLAEFQKKKNRHSQLEQCRQQRASLGKDIDALVKACIDTTLQSGSSSHLTQDVQSFIKGPWQAYLYWLALNEGIQSALWEDAKADLTKLIRTMDVSIEWLAGQRALTINKLRVRVDKAFEALKLPEQESGKWRDILYNEWHIGDLETDTNSEPKSDEPNAQASSQEIQETSSQEEEDEKEKIIIPKNFPKDGTACVEEIDVNPINPFGKI